MSADSVVDFLFVLRAKLVHGVRYDQRSFSFPWASWNRTKLCWARHPSTAPKALLIASLCREPMCVCGQICFEYPPYGAKHFLLPLPQQLPSLILMCLHLCLHICSFFLNNVWLIQLSNEKQGLSWDIDRLHICWISNWVWNLSTLRKNILGEILMRTGIHHLFMSYFYIFSLCFHPWKFQLKKNLYPSKSKSNSSPPPWHTILTPVLQQRRGGGFNGIIGRWFKFESPNVASLHSFWDILAQLAVYVW